MFSSDSVAIDEGRDKTSTGAVLSIVKERVVFDLWPPLSAIVIFTSYLPSGILDFSSNGLIAALQLESSSSLPVKLYDLLFSVFLKSSEIREISPSSE